MLVSLLTVELLWRAQNNRSRAVCVCVFFFVMRITLLWNRRVFIFTIPALLAGWSTAVACATLYNSTVRLTQFEHTVSLVLQLQQRLVSCLFLRIDRQHVLRTWGSFERNLRCDCLSCVLRSRVWLHQQLCSSRMKLLAACCLSL